MKESKITISFQGDRFGGALDGAAKMFSKAFDQGLTPNEFVTDMRKQHKLIMGIGHRVKSVSRKNFFVTSSYKNFRSTILTSELKFSKNSSWRISHRIHFYLML